MEVRIINVKLKDWNVLSYPHRVGENGRVESLATLPLLGLQS